MSIINLQNKISFMKGNIAFSLLAIIGLAAFVLVGFNQPTQNVFLGAQVGKGGATAPSSPISVVATPGDAQVELSWEVESDGGSPLTDHRIGVYSAGKLSNTISTKSGDTNYTVTGLKNDTEYGFIIAASNAVGTSEQSSLVSATPAIAKQSVEPSEVLNLEGTPGDGSIELSWLEPVEDGGDMILNYILSVTVNGRETIIDLKSTNTGYLLDKLTNNTKYVIKVAAENSVGIGTYSDPIEATPSAKIVATVPETPSGITLTPGDSTLSVSWTAPSNGGSSLTEYNISYTDAKGVNSVVSVNQSKTSHILTGLINGMSYTVAVRAVNAVGSGEYSVEVKGSPDKNIAPSIVGLATVVVSDTSAVISWSTNKNTSTRVDFGLLSTKTSTPEYNKNTRVMEHSVTIVDLLPCTTYSFTVKSYDSLSQVAIGGEQKFTTTGCVTTAEIQKVKEGVIDTTVGGIIDFADADVKTKLEIPQNLKAGESEVVFQVKLLEKLTTKEEIGLPEQKVVWVGEHVYNLAAYSATSEQEVNNFDQPITVTIEYTREDIKDIDLNTLVIHHYEEEIGWRKLNQCVNSYNPKTGLGEISCNTNSFSIFGLFGENASGNSVTISTGVYVDQTNLQVSNSDNSVSSSSSNGKSISNTTKESLVILSDELKTEIENDKNKDDSSEEKITIREFNQDLWYGTAHFDVISLQKFLNEEGFILAESGPGSPGRETAYFGDRTFSALKNFQTFYQDSIVAPTSFQKASGYLDYFTRQFIQENF